MHDVYYGRAHNCVTGESQTVLAWLGTQLIYLVYNVSEEKHISAHNIVTYIQIKMHNISLLTIKTNDFGVTPPSREPNSHLGNAGFKFHCDFTYPY